MTATYFPKSHDSFSNLQGDCTRALTFDGQLLLLLGHFTCVTALVSAGALCNTKNAKNGQTPLILAASRGHPAAAVCVNIYVCVCGVYHDDTHTHTLTHTHRRCLRLARNASTQHARTHTHNIQHTKHTTHNTHTHTHTQEALLAFGAELDSATPEGHTALHWACRKGHREVVVLLLGARANINSETRAGLTPLHVAAIYGKVSVVRTLLKASPKLDAPDQFGETPLHKAVAQGHEEITQLLIMHGANVFKSQ